VSGRAVAAVVDQSAAVIDQCADADGSL